MTNGEAVTWIINIAADIGKIEHQDLWHYEQALSEIRDMLESAQREFNQAQSRNQPSDCISRQAALRGFAKHSDGWCYINALPSAQPDLAQLLAYECGKASAQPEIIRCKDCKYYQQDHLFKVGFCDGRKRNNDDFCSRAERRTDEAD